MKLQSVKNRVKGKDYNKYSIVVPVEAVLELGWKPGTELVYIIKDGKLIIQKSV